MNFIVAKIISKFSPYTETDTARIYLNTHSQTVLVLGDRRFCGP